MSCTYPIDLRPCMLGKKSVHESTRKDAHVLVSLQIPRDFIFHAFRYTIKSKSHFCRIRRLLESRCQYCKVLWYNGNSGASKTMRKKKDIRPDGHVGLCKAQVCTISLPGVSDTYFPLTPPPNNEYSVSACAADYQRNHVSLISPLTCSQIT